MLRALLLLLALWAVPVALTAADRTWDGGGDGATWHDARNWSDDALPTQDDAVTIGGSATVVLAERYAYAYRIVLAGTATLDLNGHELYLGPDVLPSPVPTSTVEAGATLRITQNGNFSLRNALVVRGTLEWSSGYFVTNGGETGLGVQIAPEGRMRFLPGPQKYAQLTRWVNEGTVEFAGSGAPVSPWGMVSTGTLLKTGEGVARFPVQIDIRGGRVEVQGGTLQMEGTTRWENATVAVAAGGTLALASNRQHHPQTVAGTLTGEISGTFIATSPEPDGFHTTLLADPTLGGVLNLGGTGLQLEYAELGYGTELASPVNRGLLRVVGPRWKSVSAPFRNEGTVRWEGGELALAQLFTNAPGATFEMAMAQPASMTGGGTFVSEGRLRKTGAGAATVEVPVAMRSRVEVDGGRLRVMRGGTWTDVTVDVGEADTLEWGGNRGYEPHTVSGTLAGEVRGMFKVGDPGAYHTNVHADASAGGVLNLTGTGIALEHAMLGNSSGWETEDRRPAPENRGTMVLAGPWTYLNAAFLNTGTLRWAGGNLYSQTFFPLVHVNRGQMEITATDGAEAGFTTGENGLPMNVLHNEGTLRIATPGRIRFRAALENSGRLDIGAGTTVEMYRWVAEAVSGQFRNGSSGTISGAGTLDLRILAQFNDPAINLGVVAPGADSIGVGTLTVQGSLPVSRLVLDLPDATSYDRLVVTAGTANLTGGSVLAYPGASVAVGATFDVVNGPVTGNVQTVQSGRPGLTFAALATPATGLRLTAAEGAGDTVLAVVPRYVLSGEEQDVTATGGPIPDGSTVALACRSCLFPDRFAQVPGEVVARTDGELRARFSALPDSVFGYYDMVVSTPSGGRLRGPVVVVPLYAVPVMVHSGNDGVPIVPEDSPFGGLRWSNWTLYNVSNSDAPVFYVSRVLPPASENVRMALNSGGHGYGEDIWNRSTSETPGEVVLISKIAPLSRADVALGLGISPENVDFSGLATVQAGPRAQPMQPAGPSSETSALGEAGEGGTCQPNTPLDALAVSSRAPAPFGEPQEIAIAQLRGLTEGYIKDSIKAFLLDQTCGRFSQMLFQVYPSDWDSQLNRAVDDVVRNLQQNQTTDAQAIVRKIADKLYDKIPGYDKFTILRDCVDRIGQALTEHMRRREKRIVDVYRMARREGRDLQTLIDDDVAKKASEGGRLGDATKTLYYNVAASMAADRRLEEQRVATEQTPCTPLAPLDFRQRPRVTGPYDPNDKTSNSPYPCVMGTVLVDGEPVQRCVRYLVPRAHAADAVAYTVQFENKAQALAPAENVVITDTLDAAYDPSTLQLLGSSSDSTLAVTTRGQVVTFTFAGIFLPPNVNQPEGEGYVSFTVRPYAALPHGTTVTNRARIVFDYNPPIVTPDVVHEVVVLADPVVTVAAYDSAQVNRDYRSVWTVTNAGADAGPGASLAFTLPEGTSLVSIAPSSGTCTGLRCALGELAPGASATVALVVRPTVLGPMAVVGQASTDVADAVPYDSGVRLVAEVATLVDIADETIGLPREVTLGAAGPNPFAASAAVRFGVPAATHVRLVLYDLLGREVARLVDGPVDAGWHTARLDGSALVSGVYLLRLHADEARLTRTLVRMR